jgi:hypothetical protein
LGNLLACRLNSNCLKLSGHAVASSMPSLLLRIITFVVIICLAAGEFDEGAGLTYWHWRQRVCIAPQAKASAPSLLLFIDGHCMLADHCNCAAAPATRRTITASSGRAPAAAAVQLLSSLAPRLQPPNTISFKSLNSSDAPDPASAPSQLSALIDSLQSGGGGGGADTVTPELLDALAAFLAQEATADALLAAAEAGDVDLAALLDEPQRTL